MSYTKKLSLIPRFSNNNFRESFSKSLSKKKINFAYIPDVRKYPAIPKLKRFQNNALPTYRIKLPNDPQITSLTYIELPLVRKRKILNSRTPRSFIKHKRRTSNQFGRYKPLLNEHNKHNESIKNVKPILKSMLNKYKVR